jgi:hypothetical protein
MYVNMRVNTHVDTSEERHGLHMPPSNPLPTPLPTPPVYPSIDEANTSQGNHETRTSIANIYELLDISKTSEGVSASVLVEEHDDYSDDNVLHLVDME